MDEYYEGYGEYDSEIESFKDTLRNSVKEEIKTELERLRKENKELRETKRNLDNLTREAEQTVIAAKNKYEVATKEAYNTRYSELVRICGTPTYKVSRTDEKIDKCNLCNDQRYRHYTTPLGKEATEQCDCNKYKNEYLIDEVWVSSVQRSSSRSNDNKDIVYYDITTDDDYRRSTKDVWSDEPYEKISSYNWVFLTKEDANKYIEYLKDKS